MTGGNGVLARGRAGDGGCGLHAVPCAGLADRVGRGIRRGAAIMARPMPPPRGLNGYAGLVRLAEADGYDVRRSRSPAGLETEGLLVLTPPPATDAKQLGELLRKRENIGPTLVILPKWNALRPPAILPREVREKFKPGWVILGDADVLEWTSKMPAPYGFDHKLERLEQDEEPGWDGFDLSGDLPTRTILHTGEKAVHEPLLVDKRRALAGDAGAGRGRQRLL